MRSFIIRVSYKPYERECDGLNVQNEGRTAYIQSSQSECLNDSLHYTKYFCRELYIFLEGYFYTSFHDLKLSGVKVYSASKFLMPAMLLLPIQCVQLNAKPVHGAQKHANSCVADC